MTSLFSIALAAWSALAPSGLVPNSLYHGYCYQTGRDAISYCAYPSIRDNGEALGDAVRAAAGVFMMAGPWADLNEIENPALLGLAAGRSVIMNAEMQGYGVIVNGERSFIANTMIIRGETDATVTIGGPSR